MGVCLRFADLSVGKPGWQDGKVFRCQGEMEGRQPVLKIWDSVETGQPARAGFCDGLAGSVQWARESESQAANGYASSPKAVDVIHRSSASRGSARALITASGSARLLLERKITGVKIEGLDPFSSTAHTGDLPRHPLVVTIYTMIPRPSGCQA